MYLVCRPHVVMGDVAVRRRLLQDRGWTVVNVGFPSWPAYGRCMREKSDMVLQHVARALQTPSCLWHSVSLPYRGTPPEASSVSACAAATQ